MPTNHNYLALRGADVDDKELQEQYPQIPDEALYTKKLNDIMLDITFNNNIEAGQTEEEATKNKDIAARGLKELYAKNGLL
jgi:hypothetical protein|tara:strand:- start:1590 stop:1832 length:243 start_codon:yes stop_codon:yes gene_type:complete